MANTKTLNQALKDILQDDGIVSKWDAQALKALIMSDGRVNNDEKHFLERAIKENVLDEAAFEILQQLLFRQELKGR